jgi:hypothetical protein
MKKKWKPIGDFKTDATLMRKCGRVPRKLWACAVSLHCKDGTFDLQLHFMDAVSEAEAIGRTVIALADGREFRKIACFVAKLVP